MARGNGTSERVTRLAWLPGRRFLYVEGDESRESTAMHSCGRNVPVT